MHLNRPCLSMWERLETLYPAKGCHRAGSEGLNMTEMHNCEFYVWHTRRSDGEQISTCTLTGKGCFVDDGQYTSCLRREFAIPYLRKLEANRAEMS